MANPNVKVTIQNPNTYKLTYFESTDASWIVAPPKEIAPGATAVLELRDGRATVAYLASDAVDEVGYVTMTFSRAGGWGFGASTAEGSVHREGLFLSAGLQPYRRERGGVLELTYRVGDDNKACWNDGTKSDGTMVCEETKMGNWANSMVNVVNTTEYMLELEKTWNTWNVNAETEIQVASGANKIFLLKGGGRGALLFRALDAEDGEKGIVSMVVVSPFWTNVSAEGSSSKVDWCLDAGLQTYDRGEKPARVTYRVGEHNMACWHDGDDDDEQRQWLWTKLHTLTRIVVENDNDFNLCWSREWHEFGDVGNMWFYNPMGPVPPRSKRVFYIQLPGRAGLQFYGDNKPYNISFMRNNSGTNFAEGSKNCGLQKYSKTQDPPKFVYKIMTPNQASWLNAEKDLGTNFERRTNSLRDAYTTERLEEAIHLTKLAGIAYKTEEEIPQAFIDELGGKYELKTFLHGKETDSQGYVAYDAKNKVAVLGFRGTSSYKDFIIDAQQFKVPFEIPGLKGKRADEIKVILGFNKAYEAIRDETDAALDELHRAVDLSTIKTLYVTGHSLGAALCVMAGMHLAFGIKHGRFAPMKPETVRTVAIAAPPTANGPLRQYVLENEETFDCDIYRMKNDSVSWGKWKAGPLTVDFRRWDYQHAGRVYVLDSDKPFPDAHYAYNYLAKLEEMLAAGAPGV